MGTSDFNKAIREFANTLKDAPNAKTSPYDTQAEVLRVEGNTAWVHIPGGVDETPVKLTTNSKKGDVVQVRISNGSAFIVGNATAPPTDDTVALVAEDKADEAQIIAVEATDLATSAGKLAGTANTTANSALTIADNTAQYFWFEEGPTGATGETGEAYDTGAHITEYPKEEFTDPESEHYHSGGNLLARSNGIAVRNGMTELAAFGAGSAQIGQSGVGYVAINDQRLGVYSGSSNTSYGYIGKNNGYSYARFGQTDGANSDGNVTIRTNPIDVGLSGDPCIPRLNISDGSDTIVSVYKDSSHNLDSSYRYGVSGSLKLGGSATQSRGLLISGESRIKKTDTDSRQGVGLFHVYGNADSYLSLGVRDNGSSIELFDDTIFIAAGSGSVSSNLIDMYGTIQLTGDIYVRNHDGYIGEVITDSGTNRRASSTSSAIPTNLDGSNTTPRLGLSTGVWVVTANVSFDDSSNTSGNRFIKISYGTSASATQTDIFASMATQAPYTGWRTRVHTSGIVQIPSDDNTYYTYLNVAQNCGSTLNLDWYMKAVRIR